MVDIDKARSKTALLKCYGKNVTRDISCEIISPHGILYKFCKSVSNIVVSMSSKDTAFQRTKIWIQIIII